MSKTKLLLGDNIQSLQKLPDNSIDSVVTDGPYGLSFMNKKWDYDVPSIEFWKEVYRVLKPGGHVLSFGGTRTYHRMVVNIEDAGFEIRDQIMWLYGSGFPKSHNIGKAVDKLQGNDRQVVENPNYTKRNNMDFELNTVGSKLSAQQETITKGQSPYEGWGTALKPANEPICVARKPLSEKSIAENVLKWGTGGINVDGCRVEGVYGSGQNEIIEGKDANVFNDGEKKATGHKQKVMVSNPEGRFPANIILECICDEVIKGEKGEVKTTNRVRKVEAGGGVEDKKGVECSGIDNYNDKGDIHTNPMCPCYLMDEQSGVSDYSKKKDGKPGGKTFGGSDMKATEGSWPKDKGGASRFFYQAKVSKAERNMGLEPVEVFSARPRREDGTIIYKETHPEEWKEAMAKLPRKDKSALAASEEKLQTQSTSVKNTHPTVKPVSLMAYLVRLVTPPNGIVLDPFMGSGSTGIAAQLEGFRFCGMEMDEDYFKIASARIENFEEYRKFIK
jgi:site-specific DNA-methyltransferase (adenine-specific)